MKRKATRSRAQDKAALLADRSLQRNEQITGQVFDAVHELEAASFTVPCSKALDIMRKLEMRNSHLQAACRPKPIEWRVGGC